MNEITNVQCREQITENSNENNKTKLLDKSQQAPSYERKPEENISKLLSHFGKTKLRPCSRSVRMTVVYFSRKDVMKVGI